MRDRRRYSVLATLLALVGAFEIAGQSVLRGRTETFKLDAPSGWVLDASRKVEPRFVAILYPARSSWERAPAVMFVNTSLKCERAATVPEVIRENTKDLRAKHPRLEVRRLPSLETPSGIAEIREFVYEPGGKVDLAAFIEAPDSVIIVVSTADDRGASKAVAAAFGQLVRSYTFVARTEAGLPPAN